VVLTEVLYGETLNSFIQTYSGMLLDINNPNPLLINIVDIAHASANICRFGGHVKGAPYSVAQHAWYVSYACPNKFALAGLLHDGSEAYIGDVVSPLKPNLSNYKNIEDGLMKAIGIRFGINNNLFHCPEVKKADNILLATEVRDLINPVAKLLYTNLYEPLTNITIKPWHSCKAKYKFLQRFNELYGKESIVKMPLSEQIRGYLDWISSVACRARLRTCGIT
jgi:uncharacterized protein